MARTDDELQARLHEHLPTDLVLPQGAILEALWYGAAGVMEEVETAVGAWLDQATLSAGTGLWLSLHGRGLGVGPREGETAAQYRLRIATTERKVTKPAILAAVSALLATVTEAPGYVWDRRDVKGFCVERDALEAGGLLRDWLTLYVCLPLLPPAVLPFCLEASPIEGAAALDLGKEAELFANVREEVDRLRSAGVRVFFFTYLPEVSP